jgi:hypothetical protein
MPAAEDTILKKFLTVVKQEKAGCLALLATPKDKSAFGYGEACGILQGLDRAERLFEKVIGEEEDKTGE